MRKAIILALTFLLLLPLAKADTYLTSCATLDIQGETYYLMQDIGFSDYCISIRANNITLDCQGYRIENNSHGIFVYQANNILVKNCIIFNNTWGITIDFSTNVTVFNSTISNSSNQGIHFDFSNYNSINFNKIIYNFYGIWLTDSYYNKIFNNLFNNSYDIGMDQYYENYLNTTRQAGTRIYSAGTEIGGNYWTNFNNNGYSDTCTDADKDGFCDNPYTLLGITDYLPLSNQYSPPTTTTTTLPPVHGVPLLSSTLVGVVIGFGIITFMLRTLFDIREPKKVIEYFIVLAVIVLTVLSLIALFA
jgi:parallel beta-helix repeat protein